MNSDTESTLSFSQSDLDLNNIQFYQMQNKIEEEKGTPDSPGLILPLQDCGKTHSQGNVELCRKRPNALCSPWDGR